MAGSVIISEKQVQRKRRDGQIVQATVANVTYYSASGSSGDGDITVDLTAQELLDLIAQVDGSGSGLDADLLDGYHADWFAPVDSPVFIGNVTIGNNTTTNILAIAGVNSSTQGAELLFSESTNNPPYGNGMGIRYDSANNLLYIDDNYRGGVSAHSPILTITRDTHYLGVGIVPTVDFHLAKTSVGGSIINRCANLDNTSSVSRAIYQARVGGASAGDPYFQAIVDGVAAWSFGIDNSDSDKFKFSYDNSGDLGASTTMSLDRSGNIMVGGGTPYGLLTVYGEGAIGDNVNYMGDNSNIPIINKRLTGLTDASVNYILLCYYNTSVTNTSGFDGELNFYRGSTGAWNAMTKIELSVKKAYNQNIVTRFNNYGTMFCRLVTLTYNSVNYIALETPSTSSMDVYYTGRYWDFEPFKLLPADVSNVALYKYPVIHSNNGGELIMSDAIGVLRTNTFSDGFVGSGFKLNQSSGVSSLTVDNLTVRNALTAYELDIKKITATGGNVLISVASCKAMTVSDQGSGVYRIYVDEDGTSKQIQFQAGDYIRAQEWTGSGVGSYLGLVTAVTHSATYGSAYITATTVSGTPWNNMELVQSGNNSNSARQNLIYITASDANNPYIDMLAGVNAGTFSGKQKVRLGNLTGITDADLGGALSGYGLYSDNIYLKGKIVATSGNVGGWAINSAYIAKDTGTNATSSGMSPADYPFYAGSTYANRATAPFRVTPSGGLTATGIAELGTDPETYESRSQNLAIKGSSIWENTYNGDNATLYLNNYGYLGGGTKYRDLKIGDGKRGVIAFFDGSEHKATITNLEVSQNIVTLGSATMTDNSATALTSGHLNVAHNYASDGKYFAATFFSNGNSANAQGIAIQAGKYTPTTANDTFIGFYDGNGSPLGGIINNTTNGLQLYTISDERYKANIVDSDISGLSVLSALPIRDFNWRKKNAKNEPTEESCDEKITGYIAQEAREIIPCMVSYNRIEDMYMVNKEALIPYLHKAILELQEEIQILKNLN